MKNCESQAILNLKEDSGEETKDDTNDTLTSCIRKSDNESECEVSDFLSSGDSCDDWLS